LEENDAQTEELGAKCTLPKYLSQWKATCGGDDFMRMGMTTDWINDQAPSEIEALSRYREYRDSKEKEEAYEALLQEELAQEIV
jgi:hypothetical protein